MCKKFLRTCLYLQNLIWKEKNESNKNIQNNGYIPDNRDIGFFG